MSDFTIRKAENDSDLKSIAALADVIWHEHFKTILSPEQIDYMVARFQSYEAIKEAVSDNGYVYYMAYKDGNLCGYLGIHDEGDGVIFISKVYVRLDMRRQGVATRLFERLRNDFKDSKKWYLTVNKYNSSSIEVYKKRGFEITDAAVTDIGSGFVMDDYIMEKQF